MGKYYFCVLRAESTWNCYAIMNYYSRCEAAAEPVTKLSTAGCACDSLEAEATCFFKMATSFTVFSKTEDLDLSQIFNVGQQSNLDDFVVFNIYYDALVNCDITAVVEYLNKRLIATYDVIGDFCAAYSWSGCPPYLEVVIPHHDATNRQLRDASNTDLPHLRCHLRLGDNTEEEWLVVFLLLRLTEHFNDISIIVFDNDGQFLLMEAAFHIPSSVDPENAENRVFLRHGALHLIPPTSTKRVSLTVRDALRALLASDARYCAKRSAQASIRRRTEQHQAIYDAWLSSTKTLAAEMPRLSSATLCAPYSCSAVVPLPIAILLQKYPQLLTIALDYLPPKEHMSSGRHVKSNNDPHFNFQDATALASIVRVTFSRCQYVRLQQLRFILPMHFTLSHWKTPPKPTALSDLELRAAMILGSKLCLGLQSAYRANPQGWDAIVSFFWDNPLEGRDDSKSRLRRFVHWVSSEAPLTASGGKLCYKKQSNCPLQWLQLDKDITLNKDISYLRFSQLYYKAHREATFLTNSSNVFTQISAPVLKNDDASWLELTADDVDALIEERTKEDGFSALHTERQATSTQNDKLSDADNDKLTFSNFRDVMDRVSGLWGIEHLYDRPSNPAKTASQGFFSNFSGAF